MGSREELQLTDSLDRLIDAYLYQPKSHGDDGVPRPEILWPGEHAWNQRQASLITLSVAALRFFKISRTSFLRGFLWLGEKRVPFQACTIQLLSRNPGGPADWQSYAALCAFLLAASLLTDEELARLDLLRCDFGPFNPDPDSGDRTIATHWIRQGKEWFVNLPFEDYRSFYRFMRRELLASKPVPPTLPTP